MAKSPPYSVDLIKQLDKQYPPVRPDDSISDREVWGRVYQRRLVDSLMAQYKVPSESDDN
jgi:hypothetical protein